MTGRKLSIAAALLLATALTVAPRAQAQSGLTYTSGIQVQNLSDQEATVQIEFYSEASQAIVTTATISGEKIPANNSKTYFPLSTVPSGFKGSAVVTSDQPVAAITNLLGNNGAYAGSATGLTEGSTNVGLPLIMRGNSGFNTFFSVQNAGSAPATVNVAYTPGSDGNAFSETPVTIAPGASRTFDQGTRAELGDKFIGSASITSDQPLVAMVSQVGTTVFKSLLMYDGFSGGSTTIRTPLVMANNNGFFTGIGIQNVGSKVTEVTVSYGANVAPGSTFQPTSQTLNLNPRESGALIQNGGQWQNNKYVGSATITSAGVSGDAAQPLVAVVNQLRDGTQLGTAYEGINPTVGITNKVSAPLLMNNNSGYFTGIQCQNLGSASATITVDYIGTDAANDVASGVAAGNSVTFFQNTAKFGTGKYIGSGTITSDQPVACLVNQVSLIGSGDSFLTYNGINY